MHMNGHKQRSRACLRGLCEVNENKSISFSWRALDKPPLVIKGTFDPAESVSRAEASTHLS